MIGNWRVPGLDARARDARRAELEAQRDQAADELTRLDAGEPITTEVPGRRGGWWRSPLKTRAPPAAPWPPGALVLLSNDPAPTYRASNQSGRSGSQR